MQWPGLLQMSLIKEERRREKREKLEAAVDELRGKYGHFCLQRGILMVGQEPNTLVQEQPNLFSGTTQPLQSTQEHLL